MIDSLDHLGRRWVYFRSFQPTVHFQHIHNFISVISRYTLNNPVYTTNEHSVFPFQFPFQFRVQSTLTNPNDSLFLFRITIHQPHSHPILPFAAPGSRYPHRSIVFLQVLDNQHRPSQRLTKSVRFQDRRSRPSFKHQVRP